MLARRTGRSHMVERVLLGPRRPENLPVPPHGSGVTSAALQSRCSEVHSKRSTAALSGPASRGISGPGSRLQSGIRPGDEYAPDRIRACDLWFRRPALGSREPPALTFDHPPETSALRSALQSTTRRAVASVRPEAGAVVSVDRGAANIARYV